MPPTRRPQWFTLTPPKADVGRPTAAVATLEVRGPIGGFDANEAELISALTQMGDVDDITVLISSLGGSAFEALGVYNALKKNRAAITVRVQSIAASAASIIAMAGDTVIMERGSSMMIHRASVFSEGTASDLRTAAEMLETTDGAMADIYAAKAGAGTAAEWLAAMDRTTFFSAAQAIEAGLADEGPDGAAPEPDGAEAALPTKAELLAADPVWARLIGVPAAADEFLALIGAAVGTTQPPPATPLPDTPITPEPPPVAPDAGPAVVPVFAGLRFPPPPFAALTWAANSKDNAHASTR